VSTDGAGHRAVNLKVQLQLDIAIVEQADAPEAEANVQLARR
jgi:hypothetical protein